jgi:hypothetical protein
MALHSHLILSIRSHFVEGKKRNKITGEGEGRERTRAQVWRDLIRWKSGE